jgi:hypothetical protein
MGESAGLTPYYVFIQPGRFFAFVPNSFPRSLPIRLRWHYLNISSPLQALKTILLLYWNSSKYHRSAPFTHPNKSNWVHLRALRYDSFSSTQAPSYCASEWPTCLASSCLFKALIARIPRCLCTTKAHHFTTISANLDITKHNSIDFVNKYGNSYKNRVGCLWSN